MNVFFFFFCFKKLHEQAQNTSSIYAFKIQTAERVLNNVLILHFKYAKNSTPANKTHNDLSLIALPL